MRALDTGTISACPIQWDAPRTSTSNARAAVHVARRGRHATGELRREHCHTVTIGDSIEAIVGAAWRSPRACGESSRAGSRRSHPPTDGARFMNGSENFTEHPDDESNAVPAEILDAAFDVPDPRRRLFAILGWAGAGFAVIAALSVAIAAMPHGLLDEVGFKSAATCVAVGLIGFVAVAAIASNLDEHQHAAAKVLLWVTVVVYSVLINVFAAALDLIWQAAEGFNLVGIVASAVAVAGAAVIGVLAVAVSTGFDSPVSAPLRWIILIVLATGPVWVFEPELWWIGVCAGVLLAFTVEMILAAALERWYVPEPALAACLVAGVTAIVLLVIYTIVRFALKLTAHAAAAGVEVSDAVQR